MKPITTADIDRAIAMAIDDVRRKSDDSSEAEQVGLWMLIEDALAHLKESVPGMQALSTRYNAPGVAEPFREFLHRNDPPPVDEEDDEPEPRRLNPAEQRKRDGESCLNAEDVAELRAPVEHPGDSWMGNEDI